jgi:hypothetical protein
MKDTVRLTLFCVAILAIIEYKENVIDFLDKFKQEKLLSPIYLSSNEKDLNTSLATNISDVENESSSKETISSIRICALGEIDESDLTFAKDVITDFFSWDVNYGPSVSISNEMVDDNGNLSSTNTLMNLSDNVKTIYITDKLLFDTNRTLLRGVASGNNKTIIVRGNQDFMKETIIHEIGHTFGLKHCDDLTCVMGINNDACDSGEYCDNCTAKINERN